MFRSYRSTHELWHTQSVAALLDREAGRLSDEGVDAFLLARDRSHDPEVDAATSLHLAAHRIPHLFPYARFVIVVRPCAPWAASFLGMLMDAFGPGGWGSGLPRRWVERYAAHVAPTLPQVDLASRLAIVAARHELAGELADYWRQRTVATLSEAPPHRTLVVDVGALASAGGELSALVDVPVSTVGADVRLNRGRMTEDALRLLGDELTDAAAASRMQVMAAIDDARATWHGHATLGADP